ncbi:MAG TPA: FmdB family zinc ribbon protein [Longimicrobium sp.]|jgi:putative FmdB family regulatory protein
MPAYEYLCDTCGRTADHLRPRVDRDRPARCGDWGCKGHLALIAPFHSAPPPAVPPRP